MRLLAAHEARTRLEIKERKGMKKGPGARIASRSAVRAAKDGRSRKDAKVPTRKWNEVLLYLVFLHSYQVLCVFANWALP